MADWTANASGHVLQPDNALLVCAIITAVADMQMATPMAAMIVDLDPG
jgi:hypothetical protein